MRPVTELVTMAVEDDRPAELLVAVPIPDGAPHRVREGLARRRLIATGQQCPCGAR